MNGVMNPGFLASNVPFTDRLDREHAAALELVPEAILDFRSLENARQLTSQLMALAASRQAPIDDVSTHDFKIPSEGDRPELLIRLYFPNGMSRPSPAFLYIHGGGFILGEVAHFDAQCKGLASAAGVLVASIEYRRAPENPYPIPLEDCYAALAWLHAVADEQGIDARRIGIGGPSAGAGLAAGLALLARDRGKYPVAFQVLEAPMLDHRSATPSSLSVTHPKVWNLNANRFAWQAYLGDGHLTRDIPAYASPSRAVTLSGLPPTYICIAAHDLFLDESFDYARRLLQADVAVEFHVYEMGYHGSPRALPGTDVSVRWKTQLSAALRRMASAPLPSVVMSE